MEYLDSDSKPQEKISLVIRMVKAGSGGLIKKQKDAAVVIVILSILGIILSIYFLGNTNSDDIPEKYRGIEAHKNPPGQR